MIKSILFTISFFLASFAIAQNDGDLDLDFNVTGISTFAPSASHDVIHDMVFQADQKIVACGVQMGTVGNFNFDISVTRLNTDGTLDTSFGTNGYYTTEFNEESDFLYSMVVYPDGKILACGAVSNTVSNTDLLLLKLNADGTPDSNWGGGDGIITHAIGPAEDYAKDLVVIADGSIVVCGSTAPQEGFSFTNGFVMKFNADGTPDTSFGTGGLSTLVINSSEVLESIVAVPDGTFIMSGHTYNSTEFVDFAWVTKVTADGQLDTSFGSGGNYFSALDYSGGYDMILDSNRVLFSGTFAGATNDLTVTSLYLDGTIDSAFGVGGTATADNNNLDLGLCLQQQVDGKIVVAGSTGVGIFFRDFFVARFNNDGSIDNTFGTNGMVVQSIGGSFDEVNALLIQTDDKILCGGFRAGANNDFAFMRLFSGELPDVSIIETKDNGWATYPNPADDVVTFDSNQALDFASVVILDALGREMLVEQNQYLKKVDVSAIANGVYTAKITTQSGSCVTMRFVIEH